MGIFHIIKLLDEIADSLVRHIGVQKMPFFRSVQKSY